MAALQATQSTAQLQRATMRTSRLLDFCSRKELIAQTGHQPEAWPLVVLKELIDNALSETEYISQILGKVKRFGQGHDCHVWFVAHPAKMYRDSNGKIPIPSLYDISGSANWANKADLGIVVHRDWRENANATEIHVKKVRFKAVGRVGVVPLEYDVPTGC